VRKQVSPAHRSLLTAHPSTFTLTGYPFSHLPAYPPTRLPAYI